MLKPVILLLLVLSLAVFLVACNTNPAPAGLTPIPTLAPTVQLTPVGGGPGQTTTTATAGTATTTGTPGATTTATSGTPTP